MARRLLALGGEETMTADLREQAGSRRATRPMTDNDSETQDSCDEDGFTTAELREEESRDDDNTHAERARAFLEQCRAELEDDDE
jgi:hypothetical protein